MQRLRPRGISIGVVSLHPHLRGCTPESARLPLGELLVEPDICTLPPGLFGVPYALLAPNIVGLFPWKENSEVPTSRTPKVILCPPLG